MIETQHKTFAANQRTWQYYKDAVNLPADLRTFRSALTGENYVHRYQLEETSVYQNRLKRAVPVDVCSFGVDLVASSLTDVQAQIPDSFQEFWQDADLLGTSFLQLMLQARTQACIFGHSFLLIDSTRAAGDVRTQADAIREGIRPFVRVLTPLDVTNWRLDSNGNLIEVVYKTSAEATGSILEADEEEIEEYRYWSRSEWRIYRGETLIDSGENPLGVVPIIPLYHKRVCPMVGDSLIRQASKLQQELVNMASRMERSAELQSFSQPVIWTTKTPTQLGVGESVLLHLAPEQTDGTTSTGKEEFAYVAPPSEPMEMLRTYFNDRHSRALATMCIPGDVLSDQESAQSAESGVAKAYRWRNLERRLLTMSLNEQEAVRSAMDVVAGWMGSEFDGSIQYPQTFDHESLQESIQNLISLETAGVPPTAKKELLKAAISKALPRLDSETMAKIDSELETMGDAQGKVDFIGTGIGF